MVFDTLRSKLGRGGEENASRNSDAEVTMEGDDSESEEESEEDESNQGRSYPAGWEEVYGTFDKPIIPMERTKFIEIGDSFSTAAMYGSVDFQLDSFGTNEEHISVHLYTTDEEQYLHDDRKTMEYQEENDARYMRVDVTISNFSEWTPEERADCNYSYPSDLLMENGPYYMELAHNLENWLSFSPFSWYFHEYDEETDTAIYVAEKEVHSLPLKE